MERSGLSFGAGTILGFEVIRATLLARLGSVIDGRYWKQARLRHDQMIQNEYCSCIVETGSGFTPVPERTAGGTVHNGLVSL